MHTHTLPPRARVLLGASRGMVTLLLAVVACASASAAGLQLAPEPDLQVFGGGQRVLPVHFQNPSGDALAPKLRYRLYQSSSASAVPLGPAMEWKALSIGPNQTVIEALALDLPAVRAPSQFQVVWFDGDRKLGAMKVQVFPEKLLQPLNALGGEEPIGLVDPGGRFTNALGGVRFEVLKEAEPIAAFEGRLILVAPIAPGERIAGLAGALKHRAAAGAGIVWVQPVRPGDVEALSSAYVLEQGEGRLVIAEARLVPEISQSPASQLHLLQLAELAMGRKKLALPEEPGSDLLSQHE